MLRGPEQYLLTVLLSIPSKLFTLISVFSSVMVGAMTVPILKSLCSISTIGIPGSNTHNMNFLSMQRRLLKASTNLTFYSYFNYRISSNNTRGYYFFIRPSIAGIIRMRVLFEGWYYFLKVQNLKIKTRIFCWPIGKNYLFKQGIHISM